MSAIQKTRTPYKETTKGFTSQVLTECSNEIQICQKVEIIMNGTPDLTNSGAFKSEVVSMSGQVLTLSSNDEANKFKDGDEVVLYSKDQDYKISKIKNCVKSISGSDVELYAPIPDIPDTLIIEKNLIFRVSNVSTYRVDEYGIGRAYDAIAGLSEVEASMGEMFEGKWNRSDYSFTIDNYDGRFNPYMPGGPQYTTFALREVNVYFGFGEENEKNILVFSGVSNLNNGVSEEDEKLQITAYDISYLYNIPAQLNTFSNGIMDKDYEGEPIPIIFGNYTNYGKYVGGKQRPIVPMVFTRYTLTSEPAKLVFNASTFGVEKSFYLQAKTGGTTDNGHQVELVYSNEEKDSLYAPTCIETNLGGGKYKWTVHLYRGKMGNGTLFSSARWIGYCLLTKSNFSSRFNYYTFTSKNNEPILYYKNLVLEPRNDNYVGDIHSSRIYYTGGGVASLNAIYKICSNGFNRNDLSNFKVWINKGDYDKAEDWETVENTYNGNPLTLQWDCDNGEVIVSYPGTPSADDILKLKLFAWVSGQDVGTNIKTDEDLRFNFSNNTNIVASVSGVNYLYGDASGNGGYGEWIGTPSSRVGGGFPLGGYCLIKPYMEKNYPYTIRQCDTFLGIETSCSRKTYNRYVDEYSALKINFKRETNILAKSFVFEMELTNEWYSYVGYRQGNKSRKNLATFFDNNSQRISVYLDGSDFVCVDYLGITTRASNKNLWDINKIYGLKVVKDGSYMRIYIKDISLSGSYEECSYSAQPTLSGDCNLNKVIIGNSSEIPTYQSGGYYGKVGMLRFRVNNTLFLHENFTKYGVIQSNTDMVSIARKILQFGGVSDELFDETWDDMYKSKVNQSYSARVYINDPDVKTIDYVVEMLIQIGLVLTMRQSNGKMKFSLIWDSLEFYERSNYRITSYDIALNSVSVDRELNQYFNTGRAKFNNAPHEDELVYSMGNLYEPDAVKRDGNLNIWFKREDKSDGDFEFPNLYITSEVQEVVKNRIANSTPNSEMITVNLSWRHLALQVGEFVMLNHGRYVNIPCQVRSIKLDANGSSIEVKLRSLESVNFIDKSTGKEYIPKHFDGIGGHQALVKITNRTDMGDV